VLISFANNIFTCKVD